MKQYELVISPSRGGLAIDWREMLHYRDLLWILVRRDFLAQYKQTMLGPLWLVIQPLMTTVVFTVIFSAVAKIPTDGMPPMVFYLCGMLAWGYFAACLGNISNTFLVNAGLFGKVYFPRLIIPCSLMISRLIAFGIQLIMFAIILLYFKYFTQSGTMIRPGPWVVVLPGVLMISAGLGMGVGLWMAAFTTRYRDVAFLSSFLIQLWMYATPVVYPLSVIPEQWRWVAMLNPMTFVVECFRKAFLGVGLVNASYLMMSVVITIIVLISGVIAFSKAERTFVDTI